MLFWVLLLLVMKCGCTAVIWRVVIRAWHGNTHCYLLKRSLSFSQLKKSDNHVFREFSQLCYWILSGTEGTVVCEHYSKMALWHWIWQFCRTLKTAVSRGCDVMWQCLSPYWCPHCYSSVANVLQDCAMAEVVSLHPVTMEAWVQFHLLFVALGQVSLWVLYVTLVSVIPPQCSIPIHSPITNVI